jgi:hypothetical protein
MTSAVQASARWPETEWLSDFPLVAERGDDAADAPAVLISYLGCRSGTCAERPVEDRLGIAHDQQRPAGCSADCLRAVAFPVWSGRCDPERGTIDSELGDDVISFTNAVKDAGAERRLVEGNGGAGLI